MKTLVSGGAGFIGSYIVDELIKLGHDVVIMDDLSGCSYANVNTNAEFFRKSVANYSDCKYVTNYFKPDALWHLAANARKGASFYQPANIVQRNHLGYVQLLEQCIRRNSGFKKVVCFSSMSVYGKQPGPFTEDMELFPDDVYADSKRSMEHFTKIMGDCFGFEWVIIRPHNVFGERQCLIDKYRNVIAIWMNQMMRGEQTYIYGDGEQRHSFSYILDSLPAMMKAGLEFDRQIFNIGGLKNYSVNEIYQFVEWFFNRNTNVIHLPQRFNETVENITDDMKAVEMLGLKEPIGVPRAIGRMYHWAIEQGPKEWRNTEALVITNETTPKNWM